jgi:UDP-N-acetylglucosamine 2-epimerase (non-hydrolysing)
MNLKTINIRDSQERHEGFEEGIVPLTGLNLDLIDSAITYLLSNNFQVNPVKDYETGKNASSKIITILHSFIHQINKKNWFKS